MEIKNTNNQEIDVWRKKDVIRQLFAPTLTNDEFMFFMGLGKSMQANPFKREIWAIKYDKNAPASIFLARDFYRKVAQSQPDYKVHRSFAVYENDQFKIKNGVPDHEFTLKNRGKLIGAYAELIKKDIDQSFVLYVDFQEYNTGRSNWKKMPATMISKVAEAQVLRMAYQNLFSGTHSEDEQDTIENAFKPASNEYKQEPPVLEAQAEIVPDNEPLKSTLFDQPKNESEENYHEKIEQFLLAEFSNEEEMGDFLEKLTGFPDKKTGEIMPGKRDFSKLSNRHAQVTYGKIKKEFGLE